MSTTTGQTVMVEGRIVWTAGDLFEGKVKTEFNSQAPKLNAQGEQMREYGFGLAVPKADLSDPKKGEIWAAMHAEAYSLYPSRQVPPAFGWKYKDGDGVDHNGAPFSQREGYAGHLVFALSTIIPVKYFKWENNQNVMIPEGIKCGDYVQVQVTVKAHPAKGQGKPGLYLNPMAVRLIGYGKEIINAPSGDQIFGMAAPAVPQGASTTPIGPTGVIMAQPTAAPQPQQFAPPPQAPQAAPVAPHFGVLPQVHQPQAAPQQPPAMPQYAPQPQQPMTSTSAPQMPGFPQVPS